MKIVAINPRCFGTPPSSGGGGGFRFFFGGGGGWAKTTDMKADGFFLTGLTGFSG
jgi:hypothetical protein